MENEIIESVAFIKSSKNRYKVLYSLSEGIKIPSEISRETEIRLNHVSALLKDLKENGYVVCLNENYKKGRMYALTETGKNVLNILK
ncbi:ArsR family transcriptional regulator [Methanobrevibacter sp.]|uniref:ArsR family transcriptional regulator n=1 Tax=Methanobrevibacter sp. TaxID=66852 RepID=UPI0038702D78